MSDLNTKLDAVFGPGQGATPEARARGSAREFVRGLDQLSEARPKATGRRLTAREALEAYGFDALQAVAAEGSIVLAPSWDVPGKVLSRRRQALGLEVRAVAKQARVTEQEVSACEASRRLPLRTYEQISRTLGLDERFVAVRAQGVGNESVTVRLRTIGEADGSLASSTVAALAEAAWVGATQSRLEAVLGLGLNRHGLQPNPSYGTSGYPAYMWGYDLAGQVRQLLQLDPSDPVRSMRELVEEYFGIPLIQAELGEAVAGATLESDGHRCIVVNLSGENRNVLRRRATIAHELGHLLFDLSQYLESLRVDTYEELDEMREKVADKVEQRANAFAVELLAPQQAILDRYRATKEDALYGCMEHFGIGFTAGRYQIWNGSRREIPLESISTRARKLDEQRELTAWEGIEAFTVNFPMHPLAGVRPSRQGRFCAVVLRAAEQQIISWDTAASHLEVTEAQARKSVGEVREFFPSVWSTPT
jgi:Zn-dependent peptidase ImmA (M78 family)